MASEERIVSGSHKGHGNADCPAQKHENGLFEVLPLLTKVVPVQTSCSHLFSLQMTKCIVHATDHRTTASLLLNIVALRTCVLQQSTR